MNLNKIEENLTVAQEKHGRLDCVVRKQASNYWYVNRRDGVQKWLVTRRAQDLSCSCPEYAKRGICSHIWSVACSF